MRYWCCKLSGRFGVAICEVVSGDLWVTKAPVEKEKKKILSVRFHGGSRWVFVSTLSGLLQRVLVTLEPFTAVFCDLWCR